MESTKDIIRFLAASLLIVLAAAAINFAVDPLQILRPSRLFTAMYSQDSRSQNAGLIEVRGLAIRRLAYEPAAVVGQVVDLAAADGGRLPEAASLHTVIEGIRLPRLPVAPGADALGLVRASLAFGPVG